MSELKRFDIVGKYSDEDTMYEYRPDGECYDADEVDVLISIKDKEIADLIEKNKRLANKDLIMASETIKDLFKEINRYKYKRCEAMAECRDAQARLFHRFGTEVMLNQLYGRNPAVDMGRMDRRLSRCRLASQLWKKRAEKFKDGK